MKTTKATPPEKFSIPEEIETTLSDEVKAKLAAHHTAVEAAAEFAETVETAVWQIKLNLIDCSAAEFRERVLTAEEAEWELIRLRHEAHRLGGELADELEPVLAKAEREAKHAIQKTASAATTSLVKSGWTQDSMGFNTIVNSSPKVLQAKRDFHAIGNDRGRLTKFRKHCHDAVIQTQEELSGYADRLARIA